MDRFIESNYIAWLFKPIHLKSNMDRFIENKGLPWVSTAWI